MNKNNNNKSNNKKTKTIIWLPHCLRITTYTFNMKHHLIFKDKQKQK